jgi:large subunit ribosomal protein L15
LKTIEDKYVEIKANTLYDNLNSKPVRKRLGRGYASGHGKTSGRGHKGQGQRATKKDAKFEGGQTPLQKRLPKLGRNKLNKNQ